MPSLYLTKIIVVIKWHTKFNLNTMESNSDNDRALLEAALAQIALPTEGQTRLQRAATDVGNPEAVFDLRALVHSESFARLDESTEEERQGLLATLKGQYDALPEENRTYTSKVYTWEDLLSAVPNIRDLFLEFDKLENPQVICVDNDGQLHFTEAIITPRIATMGLSYSTAREMSRRVIIVDENGFPRSIYGKTQVPAGSRIVSSSGMITDGELRKLSKLHPENQLVSYVDRGKKWNTDSVWTAVIAKNGETEHRGDGWGNDSRGFFYAARFNLNKAILNERGVKPPEKRVVRVRGHG